MQGHKLNTLFFGMAHFFHAGRHLLLAAAIDDDSTLCAQSFGSTHSIHSCVATSHHHHGLRTQQWCIIILCGSAHEVHTREVLVARHHTVEVLARDIHEAWQSCSATHKDTLVSLRLQVFYGQCLTDNRIALEVHTQSAQALYLAVHHGIGQTKLWDTVAQYATHLV